MKRALLVATIAIVLGIGSAEYLTSNFSCRRWIGDVVRRGELQVLVGRRGIYDSDINRAWLAELFANGSDPGEIETSVERQQKRTLLQRLIEEEGLNVAAAGESINSAVVDREIDLLRWQFGDEKRWNAGLRSAATTPRGLRREAAANLRARQWIEAQLAAGTRPNDEECRRYFEAHRAAFQEPLRLRASHLFLAAPDGSPEEVIASKRLLIASLAQRVTNGEPFAALVAEFSEDEATKKQGGDLGYFAETRMLPEVFAAARALRRDETSVPIRSRLGFHLIRLTETLPGRRLSFEEARPEITGLIQNEERAQAVANLRGKIRIAARRN
jgi:foldase protein PrsA